MLDFERGKEKLCVYPQKIGKLIYCWFGEDLFLSGKQKDLPCYLNKFQTFRNVRITEGCTLLFKSVLAFLPGLPLQKSIIHIFKNPVISTEEA